MSERFSKELVCHIKRIEYDYEKREGRLYMPKGECCDMAGCLALFQRIDKAVTRILTFSGLDEDTVYVLTSRESWEAVSRKFSKNPLAPSATPD